VVGERCPELHGAKVHQLQSHHPTILSYNNSIIRFIQLSHAKYIINVYNISSTFF